MRFLLTSFLLLLSISLFAGECDDNLFTMSAYQKNRYSVTIKDVLLDLTRDCHLTILFSDKESKEKINEPLDFVNIKGYTFEELLSFLLNDHNLFYDYDSEKSILKISYIKTETFNIDYLNISKMSTTNSKTIQSGGGTSTTTDAGSSTDNTKMTASYEFKFWSEIKKGVEYILKSVPDAKGAVFVNQDAAIVTVKSTYKGMEKAEEYILHLMNKMHKQVMVEAKLIEVTYDKSSVGGIDWSKFETSIKGNIVGDKIKDFPSSNTYAFSYDFSLDGLFNFLNKYGKVKVLSSPKILTLNNQPAVINVGSSLSYKYQNSVYVATQANTTPQISYTVGSAFIGLTLQIIPEITDEGDIIMRINPTSSELLSADIVNNTDIRELPPDTRVKQLTSIVKVRDGQKVLIGGLVQETSGNDDKKVPLLGDIPVLGRVFHSTSKTKIRSELFILIIPTIIYEDNVPTIDEAGL